MWQNSKFFKTQKLRKWKKEEKSRIRETKHPSTDADSSTNAIGGWTKNTPKPNFFEKRKNHPKRKNSKTSKTRRGSPVDDRPSPDFFLLGDFIPFPNKNVQMLDNFFPLLFPKDSETQKIFEIRLREVGAKRPLNGTSKVNRQTNRQTHRRTFWLIKSIGPEGQCFEKNVTKLKTQNVTKLNIWQNLQYQNVKKITKFNVEKLKN